VIPEEEIAAAMELVSAAPRDDIHLPAGSDAAAGVEVDRGHLELLNDFLRDVQAGGPVAFPLVVNDAAVDRHTDIGPLLIAAVPQNLDVNQRVELRRYSGRDRHSRLQGRQDEKAPAVDGQFLNRVARDGARDRMGFKIERRGLALHRNHVVGLTKRHLHIDGYGIAGRHHRLTHESPEPGGLGAHFILAGQECRGAVQALIVGGQAAYRARPFFREGNSRIGDDSAGLIDNRSANDACRSLRQGHGHRQEEKTKDQRRCLFHTLPLSPLADGPGRTPASARQTCR